MIRIGEIVVVPIRFSLIRCGISEPVTKTVRSSDIFLSCQGSSVGLPPSAELTRMAVTNKLATYDASNFLMLKSNASIPPCKDGDDSECRRHGGIKPGAEQSEAPGLRIQHPNSKTSAGVTDASIKMD